MVTKNGKLLMAVLATITLFFSAAYMSCTKPLDDIKYSCRNVTCSNGGYCNTGRCICPIGYEGTHCETASVDKFFGAYKLTSTVIGSDSANIIDHDTTYSVLLRKTATPTTFFIDNFDGDPFYSSVVCTIDSIYNTTFRIDTISRTNMAYDHYRINGGSGYLVGDTIDATIWIRHLNASVNWQNDTIHMHMGRQK